MTLSYLALALATVLFLAAIAGTTFTFRTIAQRQTARLNIDETQKWHGIFAPLPAFQVDDLKSHLFYRTAYYLAVGVAAVGNAAIALIQHRK